MNTNKLTLSAMFVSLGVVLGSFVYIPIGVSRCFPIQHTVNILSAILLGPIYSTGIAFSISILRNILGTGSLLAFPGSMIGAFLAGVIYKRYKNKHLAIMGEILGTGILGGLIALPMAKYIMGKQVLALFFVYPFILSTIGGSIIALFLLKVMETVKRNKTVP